MTLAFAIAGLVLAAAAYLLIWTRGPRWHRISASALILLALPLALAAEIQALSHPRPIWAELQFRTVPVAAVLAYTMVEGKGIYLWLKTEGTPEPRYYVLPWSRELAEQLQEAAREARRNESPLMLRNPFERSWDNREPKFYSLPQPPVIQKPRDQGPPPEEYSA